MADAPERTIDAEVYEEKCRAYTEAVGRYDKAERFVVTLKAKIATLEQERDAWFRRWDRSQEDNDRLREAIREARARLNAPCDPSGLEGNVNECDTILARPLTEGENDGRD